jgi:SH3 domain-containing YSC84-like protein 1
MGRLFSLLVVIAFVGPVFAQKEENNRLRDADKVVVEILSVFDNLPSDLLDKSRCVIVLPSVRKAALIVGGSYGRGVMMCRGGADFDRPWSAPAMMVLEGISVGFQIGGQATDFVLLVMNRRGAESILSSRVKLGGDVSIAAGPIGRDASASSDVTLRAEILSYSRSRGLFAGISLEGSTLRPDGDGNGRLYGKGVSAKDIVINSTIRAPASARPLLSTLNSKSPGHLKSVTQRLVFLCPRWKSPRWPLLADPCEKTNEECARSIGKS